jgi:CDP-glycerol glycerophosphotransferase
MSQPPGEEIAAAERRRGDARQEPHPRLSVVVPIFNVQVYLAVCLESILTQPFGDLEVILVDDGSTDESAEVAKKFVARDSRFQLHQQPNLGLGAARNVGVQRSTGDFLAFVDSDDRLPQDAYTPLIRVLERTGSDFAVGALTRDYGKYQQSSLRMIDNHRLNRFGITIDAMPTMLADVFAVNKVFRRTFWDAAGLSFPEGVVYEDQVALTKAFLAAKAFDVLQHTVYLWRIREEKSSITQGRREIQDLRDRVLTKRQSTELVRRHGGTSIERAWFMGVLPIDMASYFRHVPGCSSKYWDLLREAVLEFWGSGVYAFEDAEVPVQQRLMGWLVFRDRRPELERLVSFIDKHPHGLPVRISGGRVECLFPWDDLSVDAVPEKLRLFHSRELRWEARLVDVCWGDGTVTLSGFALMRNVPTRGHATTVRLTMTSRHGADIEVAAEPRREPRATAWADRRAHNFDDCGFSATIDLHTMSTFEQPAAVGGVSVWRFRFHRDVEGVHGSGGFTSRRSRTAEAQWRQVGGNLWARLIGKAQEVVLQLRTSPPREPDPAALASGIAQGGRARDTATDPGAFSTVQRS